MRHLPLYPEVPKAPIETCERQEVARNCTKCPLHTCGGPIGLPPEGDAGGLLVVSENPVKGAGRPFTNVGGKIIRNAITAAGWTGPVAFDYAIKCASGREKVTEAKHISKCRPHLATTLDEVKPQRILAFGSVAAQALLGRTVASLSVRRGYAYIGDVPVFFMIPEYYADKNRFYADLQKRDITWAVNTDLPPKPPLDGVAYLVETKEDSANAVAALRATGKRLSFDAETIGRPFNADFRITSLAVAARGAKEGYVWTQAALADPEIARPLKALLSSPVVEKAGQNVKYDALAVYAYLGCRVNGIVSDTKLKRKLMYSDADASLETMAELVGMGGHKEEAQLAQEYVAYRLGGGQETETAPLPGALGKAFLDWDLDFDDNPDVANAKAGIAAGFEVKTYSIGLLPFDILHRYCALDTISTAAVDEWAEQQLDADPEVNRIWERVLKPAADAITKVEEWGIGCDKAAMQRLSEELTAKLKPINEYFRKFQITEVCAKCDGTGQRTVRKKLIQCQYCAGVGKIVGPFECTPRGITKLLFEDLGLSAVKKTPTGAPSTDEEALDAIRHDHPIVGQIIEWRRLEKLKNTYAEGMLCEIRGDGRLHPNFNVSGARTGRISCSEPNLQNVPRVQKDGPSDGKLLRDCFVAPPGSSFIEFDFSQLELRVAALLSGDPVMLEIFRSGVDYHLRTAQLISYPAWGIPPEAVTDEHRRASKTFNFGLLFGQGDGALAAGIGCTKTKAGEIRAAVLGKFKVLAKWIQARIAETIRTGESRTWWDGEPARRRMLYDIVSVDGGRQSNAQNSAFNAPIQGTGSDFCLASLAAIVAWIMAEGLEDRVKVVLTVHDSIMLEAPDEMLPMVAKKVKSIMEGHPSNGVPILTDCKAGKTWGSLAGYDPILGQYIKKG